MRLGCGSGMYRAKFADIHKSKGQILRKAFEYHRVQFFIASSLQTKVQGGDRGKDAPQGNNGKQGRGGKETGGAMHGIWGVMCAKVKNSRIGGDDECKEPSAEKPGQRRREKERGGERGKGGKCNLTSCGEKHGK